MGKTLDFEDGSDVDSPGGMSGGDSLGSEDGAEAGSPGEM